MRATDLVKQGWSIAAVKARGGCVALKALQRYLHIQRNHLGRKFKEKGVNNVRFSLLDYR